MRIKYFIPLFIFLVFTILITLFWMLESIWIIIPCFLIFYPLPYFFGIKETTNNKDAVLKVNNKTPFIMPILFYSIPTIIMSLVFLLGNLIALFQFLLVFMVGLIFHLYVSFFSFLLFYWNFSIIFFF